jgi:hypothetical protein
MGCGDTCRCGASFGGSEDQSLTPSQYLDHIYQQWDNTIGAFHCEEAWYPRKHYVVRMMPGESETNQKLVEEVKVSVFHSRFWHSVFRDGVVVWEVPAEQWNLA